MGNITIKPLIGEQSNIKENFVSIPNIQISVLPKVLSESKDITIPLPFNQSTPNITENVGINKLLLDFDINDNKDISISLDCTKALVQSDIDVINKKSVNSPMSYREKKKLLAEDSEDSFRFLLSNYSKEDQDKIIATLNNFCPAEADCGVFGKKTTILNMLVKINNDKVSIPADIIIEYLNLMSGMKLVSHKAVIEDIKVSMDEDIESTRKNLLGVLGDIKKGFYDLQYNKSILQKRKVSFMDFVKNIGTGGIARTFFEGDVFKNTEFTNINKKYENGDTAAMYVLKNSGDLTFRNLVNNIREIDLNIPNDFKHTPIIEVSCLAHRLLTFNFLANNPNVDVNVVDENGDNLLNRLLKNYMFDRATNLLEREDLEVNKQDLNGNSAFINLCIYKNNLSWRAILKFIKDKRIDFNLVNNKNRTALMELLIPYTYSAMNTAYWVGVKHNEGNSDLKEAETVFNVVGKKWYFPRKAILAEFLKQPGLDLSIRDINGDDVFDLAKKHCPEVLYMLEEYKNNQEKE